MKNYVFTVEALRKLNNNKSDNNIKYISTQPNEEQNNLKKMIQLYNNTITQ